MSAPQTKTKTKVADYLAFERGEKFARYAAYLESFTDYILASTTTPRLEHFSREAANRWVYTSVEGLDGGLRLPNVECRLELAEVFERVIFAA
jgi:hypothetical protein